MTKYISSLLLLLSFFFFSCKTKSSAVKTDNQTNSFQQEITDSPLQTALIKVNSLEGYASLSLTDGEDILIDNLDIPDKGEYTFQVLVDFKSTGNKNLHWLKRGNNFTIQSITFTDYVGAEPPLFKDISEEIGLKSPPAWKYGGPTVADIDNNGYYDFILNNHDRVSTQLFLQKERGKLTEVELFPFLADFHGTAAGDYDKDGDLDIVNSIGGGNGTAPHPPFFLKNENKEFTLSAEEVGIISGARGRSVRWIDLDLDGDLDLTAFNAEGMNSTDSIQHLFYENIGKGQFKTKRCVDLENAKGERVLVTDLNNDQIADILLFSPLSVWRGNGNFTFTDVSKKWLPSDLQDTEFINAATDIDLDNDGDTDIYLSRGKSYYETANKSLDFDPEAGRVDIRDEGNKAITAMEFEAEGAIILSDLFLWGRSTYKGNFPIHLGSKKDTVNIKDTAKREELDDPESLRITPTMATGWANDRSENGWYLGYLGDGKWRMEWVRNKPLYWGVRISLDGIKSINPLGWSPQNRNVGDILLKNENGKFVDVSKSYNIPQGGNHWGVTRGDFNNDSYQDLFIYRFGFLKKRTADLLLLNSGKGKFDITSTHGATDPNDGGHGDMGQAFDFTLDGDVDLLNGSDDNGKWYLYENEGNGNNYVLARIGNSPKADFDAYSAVVTVKTADKTYRKRVGSAGEVHSQSFLNSVHFGLGETEKIEKITVRWRNGEEVTLDNPNINQVHDFPSNTDDLNLAEMLEGVSDNNILYDSIEYFNWGSSIVKGEDGKYHLFYAQMPREHGFTSWLNDGVISRAVADSPAGPYVHQEIVIQGRGAGHWDETTAHNPWIQKYDGKYYLYYISTNHGGRTLTADELYQSRYKWIDNEFRALVRENQRIGVAVAESPEGPWQRLDQPIVEPEGPIVTITCNPAVTRRPDGGYIMLVRGDMPDTTELVRHQAIALSPSPTGPWKIQPKAAVSYMNAEDPALWYDEKRERYYGIYHGFGYMGLITSLDGLNWKKAKHYKIMDLAYKNDKGEMVKVARMERPFLYLEDDKPTVLTVSIKLESGESYSMFIPLKQPN